MIVFVSTMKYIDTSSILHIYSLVFIGLLFFLLFLETFFFYIFWKLLFGYHSDFFAKATLIDKMENEFQTADRISKVTGERVTSVKVSLDLLNEDKKKAEDEVRSFFIIFSCIFLNKLVLVKSCFIRTELLLRNYILFFFSNTLFFFSKRFRCYKMLIK